MSQMIFTYDTELTLKAACVLINSDRVDGERLGDLQALDSYLDSFGWTGRRDHDSTELKSVLRLRERLGKIWAAADDEEAAGAQVNALLRDTKAQPSLTPLPSRRVSMPQARARLQAALARARSVSFDALTAGFEPLEEAIALMAALELARRGEATLTQAEPFGDIAITGSRA